MNRYRTRGGINPAVPLYYVHYSASSGGVTYPPVLTGSSLGDGQSESMFDIVTPGFTKRKAKGEIISNPMFRKSFGYSYAAGDGPIIESIAQFGTPPTSNTWTRDGRFIEKVIADKFGVTNSLDHPFAPSFDIESMMTEASTQVLANRGQADSNMFESVAQIGQTIDLLRSPISGLLSIVKKMEREAAGPTRKSGRSGLSKQNLIEAAKAAADRTSGAWLSYRYGVLPLISDIETIVKGLRSVKGPVRKSYRSSLKDNASSYDTVTVAWDVCDITIGIQKTDFVTVRASTLEEYVADLGTNLGFTAKGLLRTPWDLVPLSFVEDWFTNLSDFMLAYAPAPGYRNLASSMTVERTSTATYSSLATVISAPYASTYRVTRELSGGYTIRGYSKARTGLAPPGVVFKHDFKFDKLTRQADSLALVGQRLLSLLGTGQSRPILRR